MHDCTFPREMHNTLLLEGKRHEQYNLKAELTIPLILVVLNISPEYLCLLCL